MNELDKYTNCAPFKYICPECKTESVWQSPFIKRDAAIKEEPMVTGEDDDITDIPIDGIVIKSTTNKTVTSSSGFKCILDQCAHPMCKLKPFSSLFLIQRL